MARIAIAALMQESNTFAPVMAQSADFQVFQGAQLQSQFAGANTEIGGFLEGCAQNGWDPVLLTAAHATSGGPLAAGCFEELTGMLIAALGAQPVDGVLLALHGAMSTETYPSGDAEICRRVRNAVGPRVPVVVSHDLHANVLPELLEQVDGLAGYRTYPHVDQKETGLRAAGLLRRLLQGEKSTNWQLRVPMLIPPHAGSTFEAPLLPVMERMNRLFPADGPACVSPFFVQPWLDFAPMSGSFTVTSFGDEAGIPERLVELGRHLWDIRESFTVDWTTEENLIDRVRQQTTRPVIISEAHDSPSGGAVGDHTGLLRSLLPHAREFSACLFLIDPQAAAQAIASGAGSAIRIALGAKIDSRFSSPVEVAATVESVSSGDFVFRGPAFHGLKQCIGPTAVLAIDRLRIVVGSHAVYVIDPELFRSQGVDPAAMDIVGVKSPTLFRAAYDEISRCILYLDMPGVCRGRFAEMPFQHIERPVYPLDDIAWTPQIADVRRW